MLCQENYAQWNERPRVRLNPNPFESYPLQPKSSLHKQQTLEPCTPRLIQENIKNPKKFISKTHNAMRKYIIEAITKPTHYNAVK
jgi:hypothetical protein